MKNRFWIRGSVVAFAFVLVLGEIEGVAIGFEPIVTTIIGEKMTAGSSDGTVCTLAVYDKKFRKNWVTLFH